MKDGWINILLVTSLGVMPDSPEPGHSSSSSFYAPDRSIAVLLSSFVSTEHTLHTASLARSPQE